jgi:hypothetical protein
VEETSLQLGGTGGTSDLPAGVTVVSTYSDPTTGDVIATLSNGTTKFLQKVEQWVQKKICL